MNTQGGTGTVYEFLFGGWEKWGHTLWAKGPPGEGVLGVKLRFWCPFAHYPQTQD